MTEQAMQEIPEITTPQELTDAPQPAEGQSSTTAPAAANANEQAELMERLKQAELSAQEHHDAWLRAKAETENTRRRAQADIANAHKFALESFASELLAVKDSLEAALGSESVSVESLRSGVELTLKQLKTVFDKFNIVEVTPAGARFDPHRHQAISMVDADAEPNTVVQVLQKGYLLNDRVIRPALVTVAKTKSA
jgi:molecular chaperone GrpE